MSFTACLRSELGAPDSNSSKIVLPGDPSYPLSTLTYNLAIQRNSSAIVYVSTANDVSEAIKCASQFRIPVVARSGGHSYASFSSSPHGLIIDVTNLKDFSFATNHVGEIGEKVTFGAGLRLGDLDMALQDHERAVPHGVFPYIGVAGHATCGGFGPTSRMYGLFSDHIVEMEVVIANGTILKASEKTNPDLFFAMRGAGPSFGIITSLTLRTHQAPTNVILFEIDYQFPNSDVAAANLYHFQSWGSRSAPSQMGLRWSVKLNHTANSLTPRRLNWKLRGSYLGHLGRFDRVIDKLTSGFSVKGEVVKVQLYDWLESVRALGGDRALSSEGINPSNHNASYYAKSFIVRDVNPMSYSQWTTFTKKLYDISAGIKTSEDLDWFVEIVLVGGRYQGQETGVRGSGSKTTSFGPRDALLLFQMGGFGPKGASLDHGDLMDTAKVTSDQVYDSLGGGRKELTGYNCYVDSEFSADRAHREYFGEKNTEILKDLKNVWDPLRVFSHPHSF
ncbi:hypothetical protein MJO29_007640 [Puccinia striiformis f. sp. tritici]|uniref:FAD-binding PCMH-type domain-containing protein n=3 Tax=Puccinia striiformis TaxID=27350 RepID=A0A0L0VAX4_9BASI|nr:hypothetical protein MJO29_007640 [Puccinia striiformis f. sp. tritici]KNE96435.1 hypothetical protein PSTG_10266 [Puccinia striiformis f. sp. tritici PST-78]POW09758.1 hypothetical protein PSTT_06570 [Puccinia striiformis]